MGLVLLASCDSKPEEADLEQAVRTLLDSQDWGAAKDKAQEYTEFYPESAVAHNMLGFAQMQLGELREATYTLGKAVGLDSTDYRFYFNLGNAYNRFATEQSGEPKDYLFAHQAYTKAIELRPNIAQIYVYRAVMMNNLESSVEAIPDLKFALELDPNNTQAHYFMGRNYRNIANKDTLWVGVERFGQSPESKQAYRDSAMAALEKAVSIDKNYADAWQWLGMTRMESGLGAEACEAWVQAKSAGAERADINLHYNCPDYEDEHTEEEVKAMMEEVEQKLEEMEEGHFEGDGHGH